MLREVLAPLEACNVKAFFLILVAALVLIPSPALADTCSNTDPNATQYDTAAGTFYFVNDLCQPVIGDGSCTFSIWIYEESNNITGLQRGDEVQPPAPGSCPPDTDIF
ncbi:MAG: hypothetical protein QOE90_1038 [Thermoplasmata archaeon]|jgi:hypothetical protein|nr:hypothetical protein [Thermoplasmata archaeon]